LNSQSFCQGSPVGEDPYESMDSVVERAVAAAAEAFKRYADVRASGRGGGVMARCESRDREGRAERRRTFRVIAGDGGINDGRPPAGQEVMVEAAESFALM
jgi:hypothetical protein